MWLRFGLLALVIYSAFRLPEIGVAVDWDERVVAALASAREPAWTRFFHFVSDISDTRGFFAALLWPTLYFFWRRRWATGLCFFFGVGAVKLGISALKILVGRPRPLGGLEFQATLSMPSGHATNAVIMFGLLAILFWPRVSSRAGRAGLLLAGLAGIFLVGLSRVYLGVHYPSDVIVGTAYTVLGLWIVQGFRRDVFTL